MDRRLQKRGFFLVSALMISIVVAFFVGAGLKLSHMSLKSTNTEEKRALLAAESGLRYVQSCQAADYAWNADRGLVVNTAEMVVYEDSGNIIGILRTEEGDFAQFRVRFNYQDDSAADLDGRTDPSLYPIDSPYVSVNNILGGSPRSVRRAEGPAWSVASSSPVLYEVPAGTACVISEGRYGPGLASLSASNLNPTPDGKVTVRAVEGYLEAPAPPGGDSAAMSAADMTFALEPLQNVSLQAKSDSQVSRLRSRARIEVEGGDNPNLVSNQGETHTQDGTLLADPDGNVQTFTEDTNREFLSLGWGDVKQATSADSTLAAGTYVIWDDGSIRYFDMDYDSYAQAVVANPNLAGTTLGAADLPPGMTFDTSVPGKPKLTIGQNIFVDGSSASTNELNIIPRKGAQENPPDAAGELSEMASDLPSTLPSGSLGGSVPDAMEFDPPSSAPPLPSNQEFDGTSFYVKLHGSHFHIMNKATPNVFLSQTDVAALLSNPSMSPSDQAMAETVLRALGGSAASMGEFDLGSVEPVLRPDDVVIEFAPPEGESAILSAKGTVRLGTNVQGEGGSITSEGDIRLVGHGTNLAASEENGLALYAQGDVVLSSLKEVPRGSGNWQYKDVDLRGVIYSWANIHAKLSNDDPSVSRHGNFSAQGTLVAYGGDPNGVPGAAGDGEINVKARSVELTYDPVYLMQLSTLPPAGPLVQTLHHVY